MQLHTSSLVFFIVSESLGMSFHDSVIPPPSLQLHTRETWLKEGRVVKVCGFETWTIDHSLILMLYAPWNETAFCPPTWCNMSCD